MGVSRTAVATSEGSPRATGTASVTLGGALVVTRRRYDKDLGSFGRNGRSWHNN